MLELEMTIRAAARQAGNGRVVVAAPYDLTEHLCRDLATEGVVCGYVADAAPGSQACDPLIAGWWTDRREGYWHLRNAFAPTVLLLGAATHQEIDASLLGEAQRKGVRRILLVGTDGLVLREIDLHAAPPRRPLPIGSRGRLNDLSYDDAFEDLFRGVRDRLRLRPDEFHSNRLLFVLGSLGPGGAERQAAYTAAGLMRHGAYEVRIGCNDLAGPAGFFKPGVEAAGVRLCTIDDAPAEDLAPLATAMASRLAPYDALRMDVIRHVIFRYAALIRAVRPAVVHTWMDYCNVFAGIAADLVGVPKLVLSGRSVAPDNFPALFQPYMRPGYRALVRRRDVTFLNNSRAGAADYARWLDLPGDYIRVVHNGFEFPAEMSRSARAAVRRAHGIPEDATVVGTITRFSEEKRPQLFIDAARYLHARHPETRFLAFGSGPMLAEMRAYVESCGLAGVVMLPGITEDGWSALAAMDVFALTSRMEGLPNVLVEAQASALPVVCTGVGGMEETFVDRETGFSVRAATPEALGDAVSNLISDPDLYRRMSERAFRHARDAFAVESMLAQTLEAYDDQPAAHAV